MPRISGRAGDVAASISEAIKKIVPKMNHAIGPIRNGKMFGLVSNTICSSLPIYSLGNTGKPVLGTGDICCGGAPCEGGALYATIPPARSPPMDPIDLLDTCAPPSFRGIFSLFLYILITKHLIEKTYINLLVLAWI